MALVAWWTWFWGSNFHHRSAVDPVTSDPESAAYRMFQVLDARQMGNRDFCSFSECKGPVTFARPKADF